MTDYLDATLTRLTLMQKAIPTTVQPQAAFPYGAVTHNALPYWTNQVSSFRVEHIGEPNVLYIFTIAVTYFTDKLTAGYQGEVEKRPLLDIPAVLEYFTARPTLRRDLDDEPIRYLGIYRGKAAQIVGIRGPRTAEQNEAGQVWSVTYNLQVPFVRTVTPID